MGIPIKSAGLLTRVALADKYGIYPSTLDAFELVGLFGSRFRQCGDYFSEADELRLQTILKGRRLGFSINELKMLFDDAERRASGSIPSLPDAD